ncbi:transglutaminase family protein [Methylocystis heyeri]|uniref:Transglutaminase family protein n=1 Tax=Methylocystis heyeri TaxID=391905 RepID=A0A6B8KIC8_9HYPH|nr:transglutaminase family protein [Methylocystis heyeri]QGM47412.1 transglutaminase family protein [Methylocystis heyeri]
MIYEIRHVTSYDYAAPVASARCLLRLLPRDDGGQRVLRSAVGLAPQPSRRNERVDFFGNRVIEASIGSPHSALQITLEARIDVRRPQPPAAALTPIWETARRAAASSQSLGPLSPAHFLFPGRLTPLQAAVTGYARESFPEGRPVLEGALDLMRRIHADFRYDPAATEVTTPLPEAFARRSGVCQDFAHIMIVALRGLGLPAAYVSGYLRTLPAPGEKRLEGADASHAWISLWCGPAFGWLQLDPTNNMLVCDEHVVLAVGRDYADVSPIDGVILGAGKQRLQVSVDVKALEGLRNPAGDLREIRY